MEFPLALFRILYPQFNAVSDEVVLAVAQQALASRLSAGASVPNRCGF